MKKLGILASLCCAFVLSLALFGCGGSGGAEADAQAAKAAFTGTWNLTSMTQDGQETSKDDISMLAALGLDVYLNLNEDGTAELVLFGESTSGTWEASSATEGSATLDEQTIAMRIDGDNLLMEEEGNSLTFEKGTARSASSSAAAASSDAASASAASAATDDAEDADAATDDEADADADADVAEDADAGDAAADAEAMDDAAIDAEAEASEDEVDVAEEA